MNIQNIEEQDWREKSKIIPLGDYRSEGESTDTFGEPGAMSAPVFLDADSLLIQVEDVLADLPDGMALHSDACHAFVFSEVCRDSVAYCPEEKAFLFYDGKRWCFDDSGATHVLRMAIDVAKSFSEAVSPSAGYSVRDAKEADKLQNLGKLRAMLYAAKSYLTVSKDCFDANPRLMNVANGTVELLPTGFRFREHRAADHITMYADTEYVPGASSPVFNDFLRSTMRLDAPTKTITDLTAETEAKIDFLQRVTGYLLSGQKEEDCFFIFYGNGRNGKGMFTSAISAVCGDYVANASAQTLTAGQSARAGDASENIADLCGKRIIIVPEPEKGMKINESFVKAATGKDRITARHLYKGMFSFRMEGTFLLSTNHLPVVSDPTIFTTGRTILLEFAHTFSESEQDKQLLTKLTSADCKSAILAWALEGFDKQLSKSVKSMPQSCLDALDEYERVTLNVTQYVRSELSGTEDRERYATTCAAYHDYLDWCGCRGYHPVTVEDFKTELARTADIRRMTRKGQGKETVIVGYAIAGDSAQSDKISA